MAETIEETMLFAFIGADEKGSAEVGLKQAFTPAGLIPLVATAEEKMNQLYIVKQLQEQATAYGRTIRLCRFKFDGVLITLHPDAPRQS